MSELQRLATERKEPWEAALAAPRGEGEQFAQRAFAVEDQLMALPIAVNDVSVARDQILCLFGAPDFDDSFDRALALKLLRTI